MRTTFALVLLAACDKTQEYKVEPVDSSPVEAEEPDLDGDGYSEVAGDCDDGDAAVHPGAEDGCDGVDNDCDYQTDEDAIFTTWYADQDTDGYGDEARADDACAQPEDTVDIAGDCNDHNAAVNPAATETCNGMDDNCDNVSDGDATMGLSTWYADVDGDSYGDPILPLDACPPGVDGYVDNALDCDDGDSSVSPSASEVCDGLDNDCDEAMDEDDAIDTTEWWSDADADAYGDASTSTWSCEQPMGYADNPDDCDDGDATIYPSAPETCNAIDDDCDLAVDESDAVDKTTWYADADGDGYGDPMSTTLACDQPSGSVAIPDDCDDGDAEIPSTLHFAEDTVLVAFPDGTTAPTSLDVGDWTLALISAWDEIYMGAYAVPTALSACGAVQYAEMRSDVEFAELDMEVSTQFDPDDPSMSSTYRALYGLYDTRTQWNFSMLGLRAAWECSQGAGIRIGVVDNGVVNVGSDGLDQLNEGVTCSAPRWTYCGDWGSVDSSGDWVSLDSSYDYVHIGDWDGVDDDRDGDLLEDCGDCRISDGTCELLIDTVCMSPQATIAARHGTHVAGTLAQSTDNGAGVAGIAFDAEITPIQVYHSLRDCNGDGLYEGATEVACGRDCDGDGSIETDASCSEIQSNTSGFVAAYIYAASDYGDGTTNVQVINDSNGATPADRDGDGLDDSVDEAMVRAATYAVSQGVFIATAAGNDGLSMIQGWKREMATTSSSDGFMVVGAVQTSSGGLLSRAGFSNYGTGLDIAAPGVSILQDCGSNGSFADTDFTSGTSACIFNGTSMASPHVAGAAALLMSSGASAGEAESLLRSTAATGTADIVAGGFAFNNYGTYPMWYGAGILQPGAALNEKLGTDICVEDNANLPPTTPSPNCDPPTKVLTLQHQFSNPTQWIEDFATAFDASDGDALFVEDVNGDGSADLVFFNQSSGSWKVALSNGLDAFETGKWHTLTSFGEDCTSESGDIFYTALMGDMDGDLAADAVIVCEDGEWYQCLSDGGAVYTGGWEDCSSPTRIAEFGDLADYQSYRSCSGTPTLGDCDEDPVALLWTSDVFNGATPVLFCDGTWDAWVAGASKNLGSCFGDDDSEDEGWVRSYLADLTGDDTDEIVVFSIDGDWHARLGEEEFDDGGYTSGAPYVWGRGMGDAADELMLGDVNGDRLPDLVGWYQDDDTSLTHPDGDCGKEDGVAKDCDNDSDGEWYVALGEDTDGDDLGDDFDTGVWPERWADTFGQRAAGATRAFLADVNADGFDDAIVYYPTYTDSDGSRPGVWKVALSGQFECE